MKIKIEIEVDTNEDLQEKESLLELLESIKDKLSGEWEYED
jgi:hypothetical protein